MTKLIIALLAVAASTATLKLRAPTPTFTPFANVPNGCGAPPDMDMTPVKITNTGLVAGNTRHSGECNAMGFVRTPDGTVSNVSVRSSGTGASTILTSINPAGYAVGYGTIGSERFPSGGTDIGDPFLDAPDGTITLLADSLPYPYSSVIAPVDINSSGVIVGSRMMYSFPAIRAFIRSAAGVTTFFDAPGNPETTLSLGGTYPVAINDVGAIAGYFLATGPSPDTASATVFLRAPDGSLTTFTVPGAAWTIPTGLNQMGDIVGYYSTEITTPYQTSPSQFHGFIRNAAGAIATFDVPQSLTTRPAALNFNGEIAGTFSDAAGDHGFFRSLTGQISVIDYPNLPPLGSCYACTGTDLTGVNDAGVVIGWFGDLTGTHGFSFDTKAAGRTEITENSLRVK